MSPAQADAFCAAALLLGLPASEVAASLTGPAPAWLAHYAAARSSQGRATQLAPRLLALRLAVEKTRLRWL